MTIDTLAYVKTLEAAGVERRAAEAQAEALTLHVLPELITKAGGFVAKYMGDGVLAYFGYPQAHEHDAERAVRAGLALVEAAPKLTTVAGAPLQVRVGIATLEPRRYSDRPVLVTRGNSKISRLTNSPSTRSTRRI